MKHRREDLEPYLNKSNFPLSEKAIAQIRSKYPFASRSRVVSLLIKQGLDSALANTDRLQYDASTDRLQCDTSAAPAEGKSKNISFRPDQNGVTFEMIEEIFAKHPYLWGIKVSKFYRLFLFRAVDQLFTEDATATASVSEETPPSLSPLTGQDD